MNWLNLLFGWSNVQADKQKLHAAYLRECREKRHRFSSVSRGGSLLPFD